MRCWAIGLLACVVACSSSGGGAGGAAAAPPPAVVQAVLDFNGHVVVVSHEPFVHYRDVASTARAIDAEVIAAQPFDYYEVVATNAGQTAGVMLKGVPADALGDAAVTDYERYLVAGHPVGPSSGAGGEMEVVSGSALARRLRVRVGDTLTLVAPLDGTDAKAPRSTRALVVGIMYVPMAEYDDRMLITALPEMTRLGRAADAAMGIELRLRHRDAAPRVARALGEKLGGPYDVMDWCQRDNALWKAMGRPCP